MTFIANPYLQVVLHLMSAWFVSTNQRNTKQMSKLLPSCTIKENHLFINELTKKGKTIEIITDNVQSIHALYSAVHKEIFVIQSYRC